MKKAFLLFFASFVSNILIAQSNLYTKFVNSPTITFAARLGKLYSFQNTKTSKLNNIYDYLINKKNNEKSRLNLAEYYSNCWIYNDNSIGLHYCIDTTYQCFTVPSPPLIEDTSKEILFDQILYLKNHKLYSYVIAAAPIYNCKTFASYNIEVSKTIKSFCSINKSNNNYITTTDKITPLNNTYQIFTFEYPYSYGIKILYSMGLLKTLWYEASQGYNKVVDVKTNKIIPPDIILHYIKDTLQVPSYDSAGAVQKYVPIVSESEYPNLSSIGIYQKWYYNITKDIFFCEIKEADLYSKKYPEKGGWPSDEKRFKIIF